MFENTETDKQPVLTWDSGEIAQNQVHFLLESGEAASEDDAYRQVWADHEFFAFEWEYLTDTLSDLLRQANPTGYWQAEVTNFGWRRQNGYATFKAEDGRAFLRSVLPDTECSFKVFVDADNTIRLQNFHHDSPTGAEWYTVKAMTAEAFTEA